MPLNPAPLALQFAGGLETKTDSKQVPATKLLNLENATFIKQTTLAKRNGYAAYSRMIDDGTGEYADPLGFAQRGDELLVFTGERAYSRRASVDAWADAGEIAAFTMRTPALARTGTAQKMSDHATVGGVTVAAWEDSRGGVYASVIESASGRILIDDTLLNADGTAPRCVVCGTVLHVYFATPATSRIYVAVVNPAAPELTAVILIDDLSAANPCYDACSSPLVFTSIGVSLMVWCEVSGSYRVGYIHPSGVVGSPVTGLPSAKTYAEAVTGGIAITADLVGSAGVVFVCYAAASVFVRSLASLTLATIAGPTAVSHLAGPWARVTIEGEGDTDNPSLPLATARWAAEMEGARGDLDSIETGLVDENILVLESSADRVLLGHALVSRAFHDNGHTYVAVGHPVQFFPYVAIVRLSADSFGGDGATGTACYARICEGQWAASTHRSHLTSVQPIDPTEGLSRQHAVCIGYRIQLDSEDGDQFAEAGIRLASIDCDAQSVQSAELSGLWLAGACMQHYDGKRWAEAQFHCAPDTEAGTTIVVEGAAGAMGAGTYGYRLAYEEIDNQGVIHYGAVAGPFNVVIAASKKVNVTVPTLRLTSRRNVRIGVFRSIVNPLGDPESIEYFRVTSIDPTASTGDNCFLVNDPTVDSIAFVDNLTDAELQLREPLYTNGGVLSNDPAPSSGHTISVGKSRLFWTDPVDPTLVRYSGTPADDAAPMMPVGLAQSGDPYGGAVVAIATLDDATIVLRETALYGFGGPGPLDDPSVDPQNNSFSPTSLITSDCGCKAAGSVCQSPAGVAFQSEKGIMLLDRQRQVQDIGSSVYAFNAQTITSAALLPDRKQVVFLSSDGVTLLWDYERAQWSKYTNHLGLDARVVGGVYHYLRTDGRVFYETPGVYLDDNAQIVMRIETAWIQMAGYQQGWQKVLWAIVLGTYKSAHTLVMRYRIDYDEGYSAPLYLDVDANYNPSLYGDGAYGAGTYGGSGGATTRYQRGIHINRPCQSISFRFEDQEATDAAGASFELSELLLIGGILGPAFKPGGARQSIT